MPDRASEVLEEGLPVGVPKSFRALADHGNVPRTTLQHRARGRKSFQDKARSQQYLTPSEEKAVVNFLVQQDILGRPVRIKYIPSIAFSIASQRPVPDRPCKRPGKNWTQLFRKRHSDVLKASRSKALDWDRFDIHDKVVHWFDVIEEVLRDPDVLPENVWNMDETGVMLSKLNSVKVLVSKDNQHGCRGARVNRKSITAIECVSAIGKFLNPMIIWPASTHRANWITFPTPGWHYAYSDKGYTDSYLSLQWLKLVFDPQTKELANQKPRVLLCDGFDTHETLEVLEFCFENKIILCRFPSHTTHELQPCDVSVFKPLKDAYRDEVERLERGCVGKIGKEHFTYLYSPAREQVLTARTIRAGWSRAGLFPWNPEKVLSRIPKPAAEPTITKIGDVEACCCAPDQATVPQTPVTPVSTDAVAALHKLITEDARMLDQSSRLRLQRHLQKLTNATHLSFDERALLREHNRFLAEINNEAKPRRATKAIKLGTARVMSYEDLENARVERAAKEAKKEAASEARKAREAKKAKKAADASPEAEQHSAGKAKRGRKRKRSTEADMRLPEAKKDKTSQANAEPRESISIPWQAPVAKMW